MRHNTIGVLSGIFIMTLASVCSAQQEPENRWRFGVAMEYLRLESSEGWSVLYPRGDPRNLSEDGSGKGGRMTPRFFMERSMGKRWTLGLGLQQIEGFARRGAFGNGCFPPPDPDEIVACPAVMVPFSYQERLNQYDFSAKRTMWNSGRSEFSLGVSLLFTESQTYAFAFDSGNYQDVELNQLLSRRSSDLAMGGSAEYGYRISDRTRLGVRYFFAEPTSWRQHQFGVNLGLAF